VQDLSAQDFFEELHGAGIVRAAQHDHCLPVVLGGAGVSAESAQRANWKHGSYSAAAKDQLRIIRQLQEESEDLLSNLLMLLRS